MSRITNDPKFAHEWEIVGDIIVTRTAGQIPSDQWNGFVNALVNKDIRKIFSLVVGPATINAAQRKGAADTFTSRGVKAIVVVDNRMTRGIITALSWLGASVEGFSWAHLDSAIAEITDSSEQHIQLKKIAERCKAELK